MENQQQSQRLVKVQQRTQQLVEESEQQVPRKAHINNNNLLKTANNLISKYNDDIDKFLRKVDNNLNNCMENAKIISTTC